MTITKFVRRGLLVLLTLLVVPLITVNVETLAETKGWDILLSESFDPAMTILYSVVDSRWFWAGFWFVSGATAGTWFTYFFSREKSPPKEASVTKPSDGQNNHVQPLDSWRNVDEYKLWQVACLWVGREPEAHIPNGHPAYPILEMLKTAVTNYKLLSVEDSKPGIFMYAAGDRKDDVHLSTMVNRGNILDYISNHKDKPKWDFGTDEISQPAEPQYDNPIYEAVDYVARKIDDRDSEKFYPRARHALRQAAFDRRITMYGEKELKDGYSSKLSTLMPHDFWSDQELNVMATGEYYIDHVHTQPEQREGFKKLGQDREKYWGVRVSMDEVKSEWP